MTIRRRCEMPKYLLQASYTSDGVKGLAKDGGTKRRAAAKALVESLGGKLEALYFAFGETDVFAIAELPDNAAAASVSLDRKSTRLNSSHRCISYAVFCLKKKTTNRPCSRAPRPAPRQLHPRCAWS